MNVGSLFSGIGGIELGFEREGFHSRWFIENNRYCQAVLKRHFPETKVYGDITKVNFSSLEEVQILTGGFPCQDISVAGKQKGIKAERSGLWKYYAKAIRVLRPEVAVVENVPALTYLGLNEVLADIAKVGYDAEWFNLSASAFGAPHQRERIFILAYPERNGWRGKVQPEEKNATEVKGRTDREIEDRKHKKVERRTAESFTESAYNISSGTHEETDRKSDKDNNEDTDVIGRQDNQWHVKPFFITDDWSERIQRFRNETIQGKQGFQRFKNVGSIEELFKRPDIPQPLIRRGGNGFSTRMDAYLQKQRTQAIGNAVVPQVAQFIAKQIKEALA